MLTDVSMPHHWMVADISTLSLSSILRQPQSMLSDVSMPHHSTAADISTPALPSILWQLCIAERGISSFPGARCPYKEKCKIKLAKCQDELDAFKINAWTRCNAGQHYERPNDINNINTLRFELLPSFSNSDATQTPIREKATMPMGFTQPRAASTPKG